MPVTVKMRRGVDDSEESRDKFFEILDGAFRIGVAAVTIHGRTVAAALRGAKQVGLSCEKSNGSIRAASSWAVVICLPLRIACA